MGVESEKCGVKNLRRKNKVPIIYFIILYYEEMAERFKAADCKSVEFSHRRFESCFLQFFEI